MPGVTGPIVAIPDYDLYEARGEIGVSQLPAELGPEVDRVNRVTAVVAGAIALPVKVVLWAAKALQDLAQHDDAAQLAAGTDQTPIRTLVGMLRTTYVHANLDAKALAHCAATKPEPVKPQPSATPMRTNPKYQPFELAAETMQYAFNCRIRPQVLNLCTRDILHCRLKP